MSGRDAKTCPYRLALAISDDAACCGLLRELTKLEDAAACMVKEDACNACCEWFLPSADHVNPVVSSLLYQLSSRLVQQGGAPGCDLPRARELNLLAERTLPTQAESEDPSLQSAAWTANAASTRPLDDVIPFPRNRGTGIRHWAIGITTAPREASTLERCWRSLVRAGWDSMHLFVDGPVELPASLLDLPRTVRLPAAGVWLNYFLSLMELRQRHPQAEALLIAQDDALFLDHPGVRSHLEQALWQGRGPQIASLFCPSVYTGPRVGWHVFEGLWNLGPVAFVYSREAADRFLGDRKLFDHQQRMQLQETQGIDGLIGKWALHNDIPMHFTTPSLVQHIGHTSSIWKNAPAFGNRRASRFGE